MTRSILDIYDDAYRWARQASDAGEDDMASLAFAGADYLRRAADLYHGATEDED